MINYDFVVTYMLLCEILRIIMSFFKYFLTAIFLSSMTYSAEFITIGTGSVTGTYYPTGAAICKLVNKYKKETKIRCSVESTAGSVYNVNTVKNGELDFAIAQSDVIFKAVKASNKHKNTPTKKIKSIMAIYPELLTLVTRKDANIKRLLDIKDKRINLGNEGSGNEATAMVLLNHSNIKKNDLKFAGVYEAAEMPEALKKNKIDGYFYMVGHPTANVKDAANSVDIRLIPLDGPVVDKLVKEHPYFTKEIIPKNTYRGNEKAIKTFGVKAVLITSSEVSNKAVYTITRAILENFELFRKLHPTYSNITKKSLLEGLSAPLHKGARKYYKEAGLL